MKLNNVNLEKAAAFAEEVKKNKSKALGLSNKPIVENVKLQVNASGKGKENLDEAKKLAEERCPGVYCPTNPINLDVELTQ